MQHPSIFLKERLDSLYESGAKSQGSWEASKLLSLGGAISCGIAAATNPLLGLFGVLSGLSYGWSVIKDGSTSRRFKPFPILSTSLSELLAGFGGGDDAEAEAIPAELKYLSPGQTSEALLLDFQIQAIARFLDSLEVEEREQAYKQLVRYFHFQFGAIVQERPSLLFQSEDALLEAFEYSLCPPEEWNSEANPIQLPEKLSVDRPARPSDTTGRIEGPEEVELAQYLFSERLGQDLKSILFMGESGAGKGNMLFGASEELLAIYPDAKLFAVNPKPAANEADRWQRYQSVLPVTDEDSAISAFELLDAAEAEMVSRQMRGTQGSPYVLVLDEFNTLLDLLSKDDQNRFMRGVKRIIRQGRSNWVWIWIGAQTGNCEDFKISAPDRANFIRIALGFQGNMDALQIAIANPAMFPGLKRGVDASLIPSLKNKGTGIAAASFLDRIVRIPNYLETLNSRTTQKPKQTSKTSKNLLSPLPAPSVSEDLLVPLAPPSISENLVNEYRDILSPPEPVLPEPEKVISAYLLSRKIKKTSRYGIAIFKVWKWCAQQPSGTISEAVAWERFRKDRQRKLTKSEVDWSLVNLEELLLIDLKKE
jgi:hypothetical protein